MRTLALTGCTGGGGYEVSNVAEHGACLGGDERVDLADDLPAPYIEKAARFGIHDKKLRARSPVFSKPGW